MLTIMGALVGGVLPLALHVYGNLEAGRAAGMLNASDYLGGAIGAAATASFFLPFWGLLLNMMLIAALAAVAGLLLLVNFFWLKFRGNVF
jgi:predicted membrane-bound spermidine synthase